MARIPIDDEQNAARSAPADAGDDAAAQAPDLEGYGPDASAGGEAQKLREERDDLYQRLARATAALRDFRAPFYLARALVESAELHVRNGRREEAIAAATEAQELFNRLDAKPWVARAAAAAGVTVAAAQD